MINFITYDDALISLVAWYHPLLFDSVDSIDGSSSFMNPWHLAILFSVISIPGCVWKLNSRHFFSNHHRQNNSNIIESRNYVSFNVF